MFDFYTLNTMDGILLGDIMNEPFENMKISNNLIVTVWHRT